MTIVNFVSAPPFKFDPAFDACMADRHENGNIWTDWLLASDCTEPLASAIGEAIWGSAFQPAIDDLKNGVGDTTKTMATFWINVPDPDVGSADTGVASDAVAFLQSSLAPFVGILLVIFVIYGFIRAMWDSRGGSFSDVIALTLRYVLIAGLVVPVVASSLIISREAASWVLDQSTLGTNFAENLFSLFDNPVGVSSAIALALLLFIGMCVALLQAGVMILRGVQIILLTGTILLSVAASNTETGKESLRITAGKLGAWVIYPFVAAIVYAIAFRLMATNTTLPGNGMLQCLYGIAAMLMAVFALPATMRLIIPAVGPAASGRGAGGAIAGAASTYVVMKSGR